MQKTAWENTKYSRNERILKIGHRAKPIAFAKWISLGQKLKFTKTREKRLFNHIRVFSVQKNRFRNYQISEEWDDFGNRPSCKGYSLCKMVSLGQKLRFTKTCEKRFFNHIRVCSVQKTASENTKYSRNETILKIGHRAKATAFAKWSVWVKN